MDTIWLPELGRYTGAKYLRLVQALRAGIQAGNLEPGDKLPPVRDMAWRIGITPGTVARAYSILTQDGTLFAEVGRGTFVATQSQTEASDPPPIEIEPVPHGSDVSEGPISLFSPALPNVGQANLICQLFEQIVADPPSGVMHYPTRVASKPAREAVVNWLKPAALGPVDVEDIVLCHGGQNGIGLILQTLFLSVPPVVYVEELSYPGILRASDLLRARIVPVAMDDVGMDPVALETAVLTHGAGVVCTSPEVHNPTCVFTPEARRREIVSICRKYNLHIVDDDCYSMGGARAPSYRSLAPERAWYVSSISKILTPSLRIGFALGPKEHSGALRRAAEHGYFGLATPITDLAARLLGHPQISEITAAVAERFGRYIEIALNHLGRFDVRWQENVPFLWLELPKGWRAGAFCLAAEGQGVRIRPAEEFMVRDARAPHAVRVAVNAAVPPERFESAIMVLAHLLDNPPEQIGV